MRLKQSWEDGPERQGGRRRDRRPGTGPALWVFPRPGDALRGQVHLVAEPSPGRATQAAAQAPRWRPIIQMSGTEMGGRTGARLDHERQKGVHIPLASALLPPRALGHGCLHRGWAVTSDLREAVWHLLCHQCWLASDHGLALKPQSPLLAALGVSLCQSTVKPRHPGCGPPQCWRKTSVQGRGGGWCPGTHVGNLGLGAQPECRPSGHQAPGMDNRFPRKLGSRGAPCWPLDLRRREMTLGSEVGPLQGRVWAWCGHCRPHRERSNCVFLVFLALTRNLHKSSSPL